MQTTLNIILARKAQYRAPTRFRVHYESAQILIIFLDFLHALDQRFHFQLSRCDGAFVFTLTAARSV
ncbi:Uncharacterised protein [Vibrio cholerae]|nr:Uncharacterised protein [Vibrio cholerae]